MEQVLSSHDLAIRCEDDIALVRRKVKEIAKVRGFDPFAVAAITTATSELARNTWVHGNGGEVHIDEVTDGARIGIRCRFSDQGPGISDIPRALAGGFSTARSLGLGLSGSRRLVDDFQLDSEAGRGTLIVMVKWARY